MQTRHFSSALLNRYIWLLKQNAINHWGRVTHICVSQLTIIGSDNGLSPCRRQANIWINAGILSIWTLGTHFSEILSEIRTFSFKEMHMKMSSGKCQPFGLGPNVLNMIKKWSKNSVAYQVRAYVTWMSCSRYNANIIDIYDNQRSEDSITYIVINTVFTDFLSSSSNIIYKGTPPTKCMPRKLFGPAFKG